MNLADSNPTFVFNLQTHPDKTAKAAVTIEPWQNGFEIIIGHNRDDTLPLRFTITIENQLISINYPVTPRPRAERKSIPLCEFK